MDRAANVCNSCYGEFCSECLQTAKGRRLPWCTDCMLIASGVRNRNQLQLRGAKKTAKQRREELLANTAELPHAFTYFDAEAGDTAISADAGTGSATTAEATGLDTDAEDAEPSTSGRSRSKSGRRKAKRSSGRGKAKETKTSREEATTPETTPTATETGPDGGPPNPGAADTSATTGPGPGEDGGQVDEPQTDTVGDSPTDLPNGPGSGEQALPTTPAVAKLEALKRQAREAASAEDAVPTSDDPAADDPAAADDFTGDGLAADGGHGQGEGPELLPTAPDTAEELVGSGRSPAPSTDDRGPTPEPALARRHSPGGPDTGKPAAKTAASSSRKAASPSSAGTKRPARAQASSQRQRRTNDAGSTARPTTAPMVGEIHTVGGRRSEDRSTEADVNPEPTTATGPGPGTDDDSLNGVDRFDAGQGPARRSADDGLDHGAGDEVEDDRGADTDANGDWIPPILRGMAPDAREAKANLPSRRRSGGD